MVEFKNALGLDIGAARIGVARVNSIAKLPQALKILDNDENFLNNLVKLVEEFQIDLVVVGLPRNMNGEETEQSKVIVRFCDEKITPLGIKYIFQDETLSTNEAEARNSNKSRHVDDLAAVVILEDFIRTNI
ncbi:Holliday junction resolvase RuvX [Candidatus Saccharibacteria bacterium]|nr:Holliday junction resolvase RuvX [Candidatus Saccharibacteria bacterium]